MNWDKKYRIDRLFMIRRVSVKDFIKGKSGSNRFKFVIDSILE